MRVTTGMIANQYGRNLNKSLGQLNYYNERATSFRRFNKASDDPVGASKAYSLRRSFAQNDDYLSNIADAENLYQTAHSTQLNINSIIEEVLSNDILQGINGTYGKEDRTIIATKIARLQDALLTNANGKYGDKFMFNGGEYDTQPFTLSSDGKLLYRGIDVDTGEHIGNTAGPNTAKLDTLNVDFGRANADMLNGYKIEFVDTDNVGTNSITGNVITIGTNNGVDNKMTAADLETQLKSLLDPTQNPTAPAGFDPTLIKVTGADSAGASASVFIQKSTPATNKPAEAYMGGTNIDFGKANGEMLNGYTLNVVKGAAGSTINSDQKVITISLPAGSTRQDFQDALQAMNPADLPAGYDPSKITVGGDLTATINYNTSEIGGGEPSIEPGTVFDLDLLASETRFVDLGLGLTFNNNDKLDDQSVFNLALSGLNMLGYGKDADGNPKNIYSQLTLIAEQLKSDDFDISTISPYVERLTTQKDKLLYNMTDTDAKATFIKFNKERLSETQINLEEKMSSVELVEPSRAIMDFKMQEYAYMAALQMGSKIIMPTFLDFMR